MSFNKCAYLLIHVLYVFGMLCCTISRFTIYRFHSNLCLSLTILNSESIANRFHDAVECSFHVILRVLGDGADRFLGYVVNEDTVLWSWTLTFWVSDFCDLRCGMQPQLNFTISWLRGMQAQLSFGSNLLKSTNVSSHWTLAEVSLKSSSVSAVSRYDLAQVWLKSSNVNCIWCCSVPTTQRPHIAWPKGLHLLVLQLLGCCCTEFQLQT